MKLMGIYCLDNARTDEQRAAMLTLEEHGICVFCPTHLVANENQSALHHSPLWTVIPNAFPYAGTKIHLLLIPNEHVSDLLDLSTAAQTDLWSALRWAREHYNLTYYGLGTRNGNCQYSGGTVYHVHVHVIVGDTTDPEYQPVRMTLSSRPAPPEDVVR